jgi:hypothetical protein
MRGEKERKEGAVKMIKIRHWKRKIRDEKREEGR